jgi:hypothetical protein
MTKRETKREVWKYYNALPYEWEPGGGRRLPHFVTVEEAAFIRNRRNRRTRRAAVLLGLALLLALALLALALVGGAL